jgi:cytoskeletal protein CcmA (bactofilin family)
MFKKTEESEWTRFSRALGGAQPTAPQDEAPPADEPELPVTLSQAPEATTEPLTPPPPVMPEPAPEPEPEPVAEPARSATYPATPPLAASMTRIPDLERGETIIGEGASVEGTVRSERSIRVRGAVQGEIESGQRVVVEEAATVKARVVAENVTILGEVNGSIECTGRVEIAASGKVAGEVTAGTLVIQEGAFFEGHLKMASRAEAAPAQ